MLSDETYAHIDLLQ